MTSANTPVEVGQTWESRDGSRQIEIVSIPRPGITDPLISVQGQRRSEMRRSTLVTRYRLFQHAGGRPAMGSS